MDLFVGSFREFYSEFLSVSTGIHPENSSSVLLSFSFRRFLKIPPGVTCWISFEISFCSMLNKILPTLEIYLLLSKRCNFLGSPTYSIGHRRTYLLIRIPLGISYGNPLANTPWGISSVVYCSSFRNFSESFFENFKGFLPGFLQDILTGFQLKFLSGFLWEFLQRFPRCSQSSSWDFSQSLFDHGSMENSWDIFQFFSRDVYQSSSRVCLQ